MFDPGNPETYGPHKWHALSRIAAMQPGKRTTWLLAAIACVAILLGSSPEDGPAEKWGAFFIAPLGICLMIWLCLGVMNTLIRLLLRRRAAARPAWSWHWLSLPIVCLVIFHAFRTSWFWNLRWSLSRSSFVSLASTPPAQWTTGRIGLFYMRKITTDPNGDIRLVLGFPDWYSENPVELRFGKPPTVILPWNKDLGGGLWVFWEPF